MCDVASHAVDETHEIFVLDSASHLQELACYPIDRLVSFLVGMGAMAVHEEGHQATAKVHVALARIFAVRSQALDERV